MAIKLPPISSIPPINSRRYAVSNYALFVGLRYSFSRKRNRFTSVIAMVSMLGMVVGVMMMMGAVMMVVVVVVAVGGR